MTRYVSPGHSELDLNHPLFSQIMMEVIRLGNDGYDVHDAEIVRHAIREAERVHKRQAKAQAQLELEIVKAQGQALPGEYVYYMEMRDTIKIGFSTNPEQRRKQLVADRILAVEPGSLHLEAVRHRQFSAYRIESLGYERYRSEPPLLDHIQTVWDQHGHCWLAAS